MNKIYFFLKWQPLKSCHILHEAHFMYRDSFKWEEFKEELLHGVWSKCMLTCLENGFFSVITGFFLIITNVIKAYSERRVKCLTTSSIFMKEILRLLKNVHRFTYVKVLINRRVGKNTAHEKITFQKTLKIRTFISPFPPVSAHAL